MNVIQISSGESHTLALLENSSVLTFGNNFYGQLGFSFNIESISFPTIIPNLINVKRIFTGAHHSVVLISKNKLNPFFNHY